MDQLRADMPEFAAMSRALDENTAAMPATIKNMLRQLESRVDGFPVDQLQHALQTATRAERAGAGEEMIVAALCHDVGKLISIINHGPITAEILRPYVSEQTYHIIRTHQDFQGRYLYAFIGKDPNERQRYQHEPWYHDACRFSDAWDQTAFDPDYDAYPLEHFEPMIDRVFARPMHV
jgi:predicted HD phosphohydrolase